MSSARLGGRLKPRVGAHNFFPADVLNVGWEMAQLLSGVR